METTQAVDDTEARLLLGDYSPNALESAFEILNRDWARKVCGWLRKSYPGLLAEDLAEIWQEVLIAVFREVENKTYDMNRPLAPWLFTIAQRRAVDRLRQATSAHQALAQVEERLRRQDDSVLAQHWREWDGVERREFQERLRGFIARLPENQRAVIQVFVDCAGQLTDAQLRAEVSRRTHRDWTLASVKRALQEARTKVREFLRKQGYLPEIRHERA